MTSTTKSHDTSTAATTEMAKPTSAPAMTDKDMRPTSLWDLFTTSWPRADRWFESLIPSTGGAQLRVEEEWKDDVLTIRCEAPGVDPDKDVNVWVENNVLHVEVHRRTSTSEKSDGRMRSEFRYGQFRRSMMLPDGVDANALKATYRDGILEVSVPVPAPKKAASAKIPVTTK